MTTRDPESLPSNDLAPLTPTQGREEMKNVQPLPWRAQRDYDLWAIYDVNDFRVCDGLTKEEALFICESVNKAAAQPDPSRVPAQEEEQIASAIAEYQKHWDVLPGQTIVDLMRIACKEAEAEHARFKARGAEIDALKASSLSSSSHTSGVCERCGVFSDPLYHTCEACRAEFNRLAGSSQSQPEGWQDIATAPKDGKPFCGGWIHRIYGWCWGAARWQNDPNIEGGGYFYADGGGAPTHWMPLPLPPVPQTGT